MSTVLYQEQENGNLKLIAEVEGEDKPDLAVDALLDENPRLKVTEFVAVVGGLEEGTVTRVNVEGEEVVQPRRKITLSGGAKQSQAAKAATKRSSNGRRSTKASEEESATKKRAPRRQQAKKSGQAKGKPGPKPGGSTNKDGSARKRPGPKPKSGSTRSAGKGGATKGKSPFKKNAASADE